MYMRCECNRLIHRAQFKFVKYQHHNTPVGLLITYVTTKYIDNVTNRYSL